MLIMKILGTIVESPHVEVLCPRRARAGLDIPRLLTPLRMAGADAAAQTMSAANRTTEQKDEILILIYGLHVYQVGSLSFIYTPGFGSGRITCIIFNHGRYQRHLRNLQWSLSLSCYLGGTRRKLIPYRSL
jgi:hypothetical protein